MLNEGYQMLKALQSAKIEREKKHPKIDKVPRTTGPCFTVRLDAEGRIVDLAPVSEESLPRFWQYSLANGSTFPVIRFRDPLAEPITEASEDEDDSDKSAAQVLREKISKAIPRPISDKDLTYFKGLYRENGEIHGLLAALRGKAGGEKTLELIRRFQIAFPSANGIVDRDALQATFYQLCVRAKAYGDGSGDEKALSALNLLLFEAASGGGKTVQLAFDLDTDTIYLSDVRKKVTGILLDTEKQAGEGNPEQRRGVCALSGEDALLQSQTFPTVRLPILFEKGLPLFSMNSKEAECNSRYHRKDSELYPAASQTALDIQDAYGYLLQDNLKGRTWQIIPSEVPDSRDLLIAYVDSVPKFSEELAAFFDRAGDAEEDFAIEMAKVCQSLESHALADPEVSVSLTVIRKASEGQGYVLFSVMPPAQKIVDGAREWQEAMTNVPDIRFPVFRSGENGAFYRSGPFPIKPGNIVALLNEAWTEAKGTAPDKGRANKLRGEGFAVALSLMIGHPYDRDDAAKRLLVTLLKHTGPLLLRIGACQWRGGDFSPFKNADRKKALRAVSLLGLILTALNSQDEPKEKYMEEPAFLIGRFLALADRLHYNYCMVVRSGQAPPNLIGNAAMATALKNPRKAFSMLSERIRIYEAWARTVPLNDTSDEKVYGRDKEGKPKFSKRDYARFSKALLSRDFAAVSDALHTAMSDQPFKDSCSDQDRAQMLLCYLASTKNMVEKNDNSGADEDDGSQPQEGDN